MIDLDGALPPTTALADVLLVHGLGGCLTPPLRAVCRPQRPLAGRALTVRLVPQPPDDGSAFDRLYEVLSGDLAGRVVVLGGASAVPGAVWGQILSRAAARQGAVAAVVGGAVRDGAELAGEALPVFAEAERTVGAVGMAQVEAVGVSVDIGGNVIAAGDVVVVDAAGAVCLPAASAQALLDDGRRLAAAEAALLEALREGAPLRDAYALKREVVQALRRAVSQRPSVGISAHA